MSEHQEGSQKRQRFDSIIHGVMNEHRDYKRMKTGDSTWSKVAKIISKPSTRLMLIEVPKGFNINQLNSVEGKLNLNKRIKKAQEHGLDYTKIHIPSSDSSSNYTIGIEVMKHDNTNSFNGAAHISQLITLLPKKKESDDAEGNLEIGKGIDTYMKVSQSVITKEITEPQPKHIIRNKPKMIQETSQLAQQDINKQNDKKKSSKKHKKEKKHQSSSDEEDDSD